MFCGAAISATAQDIHFSQFYASPLTLNPALTGVSGCDMRFTANYRNQWASVLQSRAFQTFSGSFDMRRPVGRYDYFGIGGALWNDRVGSAAFSTTQGFVSASYIKRLGGYRSNESYLSAGAQLGVTQRDINASALLYGDQWTGDDGSVLNPTTERAFDPNFIFADMSAGVMYFTALNRDNSSNFYAGLSFSHLNRANMSFTRRTFDALYTKMTLHVGGEFMVNDKVGIVPALLYMKQGPAFEVNAGTSLKFKLQKSRSAKQAFYLGGAVRLAGHYESALLSDAAILSTRFDFNSMSLGLSYDINVSGLSPASNSNGAFELSLMYKICKGKGRKFGCPDF